MHSKRGVQVVIDGPIQDKVNPLAAANKPPDDQDKSRGPSFMELPFEIRNMVYHYLLVAPHGGYVKCDIENYYTYGTEDAIRTVTRKLACRAELQIFRVNKMIKAEASSVFYDVNTFAIADRQNLLKRYRNPKLASIKHIDVRQVSKWHIITRGCRWKSNCERSSPRVYRAAAIEYVSMLGEVFSSKPHRARYLLIDCLSGFGASARMVMNIFRPLQAVTGLKHVHIISTDKDHFPYLRYLEQSMMDQNVGFNREGRPAQWLRYAFEDVEDKTEQAKVGNELARLLHIEPCYPTKRPLITF